MEPIPVTRIFPPPNPPTHQLVADYPDSSPTATQRKAHFSQITTADNLPLAVAPPRNQLPRSCHPLINQPKKLPLPIPNPAFPRCPPLNRRSRPPGSPLTRLPSHPPNPQIHLAVLSIRLKNRWIIRQRIPANLYYRPCVLRVTLRRNPVAVSALPRVSQHRRLNPYPQINCHRCNQKHPRKDFRRLPQSNPQRI